MGRHVGVVERIEVERPASDAVAAIWNIKNIELTERKADHVDVHPESDREGTYSVQGRFAGLPWKGHFRYDLHDTGFHSIDAARGVAGPVISGGFTVAPTGAARCMVFHYEDYVVPWWLAPAAAFIRLYLRRSMKGELRGLRALILQAANV
jgi:hypothetical protein